MPYSLPSRYLNLINRVGLAADKEKTSPVLSCVLVRIGATGDVALAATDGKILAECRVIGEAVPEEPIDYLIPWAISTEVRAWFKEAEKVAKKAPGKSSLGLHYDGKDLVLTYGGMQIRTRKIDATFPAYHGSVDQSAASPARVALNAEYLARVHDIVADGASSNCGVKIRQGRGWIFEPMRGNTDGVRCLIMPLSLPQEDGTVTPVAVNPDRLKELEGYESAVKSGQVSTSPDPALIQAAQAAQARVSALEAELAQVRGQLSQALINVAPAPVSVLVKWAPHNQGEQLKAAGVSVADLKSAGFRWVHTEWMGETPECRTLLERILAASP